MVSKEEFISYVQKVMKEDKNKIKKMRMSIFYIVAIAFFLLIGIINIIKWFDFLRMGVGFIIIGSLVEGVIYFVIGIIMIFLRKRSIKYYENNHRVKIINYLLKDNHHSFDTFGKTFINAYSLLKKSQFSHREFDNVTCKDILKINIPHDNGRKSKINLILCDLKATYTSVDEKGNETTFKTYEGIFGYVCFDYNFKCVLSINQKYKIKGKKLEKIILEDIKFNNKFKVESDNQIEARYILEPKTMEYLTNLGNNVKKFKVVFVDNYMCVGVPGENLLELNSTIKNSPELIFSNLYDEIKIILDVVETIKNNNKIFKM